VVRELEEVTGPEIADRARQIYKKNTAGAKSNQILLVLRKIYRDKASEQGIDEEEATAYRSLSNKIKRLLCSEGRTAHRLNESDLDD